MPAWLSNSKPAGPAASPGKDPQAAPRPVRAASLKRVDSIKATDPRASLARRDSTMRSGRCLHTPFLPAQGNKAPRLLLGMIQEKLMVKPGSKHDRAWIFESRAKGGKGRGGGWAAKLKAQVSRTCG